jgi:hypothetical protein
MKGTTHRDALLELSVLERAIGAGQLGRDNERFPMSDDDKKRDRALQRRVRERQAKTGESYQAAWRQLTGSDAPTEDDLAEGAPQTVEQQLDAASAVDPGQPIAVPARLVLPLYVPRVLPHQAARISSRPKNGAFDIERLFLSGAGTPGGAADWVVNDIEVDGRSQLTQKDLPGALFGTRGVASTKRGLTSLTLSGFDPVERGCELAVTVTYVGPNPEGIFFASVVGTRPPQRGTVVPIVSAVPIMARGQGPQTAATITARVQNARFQINRIEIDAGWDWIVEDVRINGKGQFCQPGGIPGDMFATDAIDGFVSMETCDIGGTIEIDVNYCGTNEEGSRFRARLEGIVVRDDANAPPPDLHVVVRTNGQDPGEQVIATCDWRDPATDDRTP